MSGPAIRHGNSGQTALVRPMTLHDVPQVVQIHQAAFRDFFLTFLGDRFLRLLYGEAVRLEEIALVAEVDGDVIALAMGSAHPGGFYKKLIKRRLIAFAVAAVPAVLRQPSVAIRVSKALLTPRTAAKPVGTATLMSLAVEPSGQGFGAGRQLVAGFADEARRCGASVVGLETDRFNNDAVNSFYVDVGFRLAGELTTSEGRALNEYKLDL